MTQVTNQARVIRRYANRKLYDIEASSYITLKSLVETVAAGQTVQVIDHETKNDITAQTLMRGLIETEADQTDTVTATDIIRAGGLSKYVASLKAVENA